MTQTCCGNTTLSTVDRCGRAGGPRALDVPRRGTQFLTAGRGARATMAGRTAGTSRTADGRRFVGARRAARAARTRRARGQAGDAHPAVRA